MPSGTIGGHGGRKNFDGLFESKKKKSEPIEVHHPSPSPLALSWYLLKGDENFYSDSEIVFLHPMTCSYRNGKNHKFYVHSTKPGPFVFV